MIRGWRGRRNEELLSNGRKVSATGLNPPVNTGDGGSILGSGRSSGERNGNPLQYSCLGDLMDRGPGGLQSMELQKSATAE